MHRVSPWSNRLAQAIFSCLMVVALLAAMSPRLTLGQEPGDGTPTAQEQTEAPPVVDEAPAPVDDQEQPPTSPAGDETDTETQPDQAAPVETVAAEATSLPPDQTSVPGTSTPIDPTPSPADISFSVSHTADCVPSAEFPDETVTAGGDINYDCTVDLDLSARQLLPAKIGIDWTIAARIDSGWSIQLMSPWLDAGAWSEPSVDRVDLTLTVTPPESFGHETESGDPAVAGTITLPFGVRLIRPACSSELPAIEIAAIAHVSSSSATETNIAQLGDEPRPLTLAPLLAQIPEAAPTVTIEHLTIAPVSFSLEEQTTTGSLRVRIDNPVIQCRQWTVLITVEASTGKLTAGEAVVASVAAPAGAGPVLLPVDAGTSLGAPVGVSVIAPGAMPGSSTQTIDFIFTIPGTLSVGDFTVHATAVIEEAS